MDVLAGTGLEPQLAIPVIVVVVGALLVYVFGFQQTKEPSFAHLAVLQSSSSYKNRSVNSSTSSKGTKSSANASAGSKPKANGHVVADKEKNGVIKKVAKAEVNKENKPPQVKVQTKKEKVKAPSTKPEDFESGEWIQATSRKDKKKKTPGQVQPEPSSPKKEAAPVAAKPIVVEEVAEEPAPVVLKEVEPAQQKQTQTSPEKKDKKSVKGAKETSPKKEVKEVKPAVVAVEEKKAAKENVTPTEVKVVEEPVVVAPPAPAPKNNIAFDEMGDQWEEAKSRGAKKRTRARKD